MENISKYKTKLNKHPYRGIISEIAQEQETSRQSIWNQINYYENPRILAILAEKMKQRKSNFLKTKKQLAEFAN